MLNNETTLSTKKGKKQQRLQRSSQSDMINSKIFQDYADYCHAVYLRSPIAIKYQTEVRGHKPETLSMCKIGYTDAGVKQYMLGKGYTVEQLKAASILSKYGKAFYPPGVFVYPHFLPSGDIGHVGMKPMPRSRIGLYQIRSSARHSEHVFYCQHTIGGNPENIILVEGENDASSLLDVGWSEGLLATNGSLSNRQVMYLASLGDVYAAQDKRPPVIHCCFDNDNAGRGYLEKLKAKLPSDQLRRIVFSDEFKDVDDFIRAGRVTSIEELLQLSQDVADQDDQGSDRGVKKLAPPSDPGVAMLIDLLKQDDPDNVTYTEADLANFAEKLFQGSVRYIREMDEWVYFHDNRWVTGKLEILYGLRQLGSSMKHLADEAHEQYRAALKRDDGRSAKAYGERRDNYNAMRHKCESAQGQSNIMKLLMTHPGIAISKDKLDANPLYLGLANGYVYDLGSHQVLEPSPSHLITKQVKANYDPDAHCPTFMQFVDQLVDSVGSYPELNIELTDDEHKTDKEAMKRYLRMRVGLMLLGTLPEKDFLLIKGRKDTGKSVFTNIVSEMFGDYARPITPQALMESRGSGDCMNAEVALLKGIRLALASEAPESGRFNIALLKAMTGSDPITARGLYESPSTFLPQCSLLVTANLKPNMSGGDAAFWERLRVIELLNPVPRHQQDVNLMQKLRQEYDGIFSWALEGLKEYQGLKDGLDAVTPLRVRKYSAMYSAVQDPVAEFIADCLDLDESAIVPKTDLYDCYNKWARANGYGPMNRQNLTEKLGDKRIFPVDGSGKVRVDGEGSPRACFRGCRLKPFVHESYQPGMHDSDLAKGRIGLTAS